MSDPLSPEPMMPSHCQTLNQTQGDGMEDQSQVCLSPCQLGHLRSHGLQPPSKATVTMHLGCEEEADEQSP